MRALREHFREPVAPARRDEDFRRSHSVEGARAGRERKRAARPGKRPKAA